MTPREACELLDVIHQDRIDRALREPEPVSRIANVWIARQGNLDPYIYLCRRYARAEADVFDGLSRQPGMDLERKRSMMKIGTAIEYPVLTNAFRRVQHLKANDFQVRWNASMQAWREIATGFLVENTRKFLHQTSLHQVFNAVHPRLSDMNFMARFTLWSQQNARSRAVEKYVYSTDVDAWTIDFLERQQDIPAVLVRTLLPWERYLHSQQGVSRMPWQLEALSIYHPDLIKRVTIACNFLPGSELDSLADRQQFGEFVTGVVNGTWESR